MRIFAVALLICLQTTALRAEPLSREALAEALNEVLDSDPAARRTTVCLKVVDLETGDTLYDRNGDRLLTPASNLKIYTSSCALDQFGPDHRFKTKVVAEGTLSGGVLSGDLLLIGGGDAMLSSVELQELAKQVARAWKLKKIVGAVRVDNSRYGSPLKGPGWMWDDDPDYYNMPVTPLMLDFNLLALELSEDAAGNLSARKKLPADYPPIKVVDPGDIPNGRLYWRRPWTDEILIARRGDLKAYLNTLDEDDEPTLTPNDPGPWVASAFQRMLEDLGVEIQGSDVGDVPRPQHKAELAHACQPLSETLHHFNHVSENAVGEVLLHEIAIAHGTEQPKWSDGAKAISKWLVEEAGLEPDSFRLVDGSGLSRYNLISADSSVKLLGYMKGHKHFQVFFDSLPEYELKLEKLKWPDKPATEFNKARVHAKPGGMSGVSTISGYLETLDGRLLAFSLLANGYIGSNKPVLDLRERVWNTLVQYRSD